MNTINKKRLFSIAWDNARFAANQFGGKASEYFSESLKEAYKVVKQGLSKGKYRETIHFVSGSGVVVEQITTIDFNKGSEVSIVNVITQWGQIADNIPLFWEFKKGKEHLEIKFLEKLNNYVKNFKATKEVFTRRVALG